MIVIANGTLVRALIADRTLVRALIADRTLVRTFDIVFRALA